MTFYNPNQTTNDFFFDGIPFIMEGQVVDTSDPDQMGRVRVWIPALDGETYQIEQLPWADYASPFAGFTVDFPGGGGNIENKSHAAYGFWAIPKVGATVLVFCLNGNPAFRCYFASTIRLHRNRSLPAGRNTDFLGNQGPWGDAGDGSGKLNPIEPAFSNLRAQFQGKVDAPEALTRGAVERAVAQHKEDKDGTEGYQVSPVDEEYLDPQTYCFVSPGRHAIIMQDNPTTSRLRIKSAEGHQVIFDDANERIYVSTAKGKSWIEIDQDGHINIFANESISVHSTNNINMHADNDIRMSAGKNIHMTAESEDVRITSKRDVHIKADGAIKQAAVGIFDVYSEASLKITTDANVDIRAKASLKATGDSDMHLKTGGQMMVQGRSMGLNGGNSLKATASRIDLNGPGAGSASAADNASKPKTAEPVEIKPEFEPWVRPISKDARGRYWRP